jgi:hypothetical protein
LIYGAFIFYSEGNPTTTYAVIHGKNPRIVRYKVFGCPVVFKRYNIQVDGKIFGKHKVLQRGSRGIFVGFPDGQVGWLIFVREKISGSHLVVSQDVVFDQHFLSGLNASVNSFEAGQKIRKIGTTTGRKPIISEQTGDITNLTNASVSHWGDKQVYESDLPVSQPNSTHDKEEVHTDSDSNDELEVEDAVLNEDGIGKGSFTENSLQRSARVRNLELNESAQATLEIKVLQQEYMHQALDSDEYVFNTIEKAAASDNIEIAPYLLEPCNLRQIKQCPEKIQMDWIKAVRKEVKFLVENETFQRGEKPNEGDEVIPAIFVYKAKITSKGYLDKLKARCVARGDLQEKSDPNDIWAPCVFARTFKVFVSQAAKYKRVIKQLDFVGAFCQGKMQRRLFLQLPKEYMDVLPEYKELFADLLLMAKSIYGTDFAHRVFSDDLKNWILTNKELPFTQSEVDPALYIYRNAKGDRYLFLICYVDDCCYFGSDDEIEEQLGKVLK